MSNSQIIAKNTLFLYMRMIIVLIITLFTSRVVLRTLGFEDFGIYNVVGSVVVFLSFLEQALTNATYRFLAFELGTGNTEKLKNVYSMAINVHFILAIVVLIIMEFAGGWFINHKLNIDQERLYAANWLFQFSLLTFCISIVKTPFNSNIIAHERMNFYAIVSIAEVFLKLGVVYLLTLSSLDKLITYGFLQAVVAFIIFLCYYIYCKNKIKDTAYVRFWSNAIFKNFVSYSGWSLFVNGAVVTAQQSLSIFFNWFVGVIGNAALGIANQVSGSINMFVANFSQAFNPQIIKSYAANNHDYFYKLLYSTSKISYVLLLFIAVPAIANIDLILRVWLGEYPELTPSYVRAIILCYIFDASQQSLMIAIHATGKIKVHQIIVGTIKLLSIPAFYIVTKYTADGSLALLVWAGQNLVCAIARTIYSHYLIKLDLLEYCKRVIGPIVLFTLLVIPVPFGICYQMGSNFGVFLLSCTSSVVISLLVGYYIVLDKDEKKMITAIPVVKLLIRRK